MKNITLSFILTIFTLLTFGQNLPFYNTYLNFGTYVISPLTNGKIVVNETNATTINITFGISRGFGGYNQNEYDPVDFRYLVVYSNGTTETLLKYETQITQSKFGTSTNPNKTIYWEDIDVNIPSGLVGGTVYVKYKYYNWHYMGSKWIPSSGYTNSAKTPTTLSIPLNVINYLQNRNLSTSNVKDFGNYYLVEDDILISKAIIAADTETAPYGIVDNSFDQNVNVLLQPAFWQNFDWYNGCHAAFGQLNAIAGSNIKLQKISSSYNPGERADIVIDGDSGQLPASIPFAAEYPSNGRPGRLILINTDYQTDNTKTTWNLMHAIGHAIGLKHKPTSPSSFMNNGSYSTSCNGNCISSEDQSTISGIYPFNNSSSLIPLVEGSSTLSSDAVSFFSVSYQSYESNIVYQWEVLGINGTSYYYKDYENLPGTELPFGAPGTYQVRCTLTGGKYGTFVATKTVTIN